MRRAAKIDVNQPAIVETFAKAGWSVLSLAGVGKGVHDLLIGRPGINVLVEIKNGDNPPSGRSLTEDQVEFHAEWLGPQDICTSIEEANRIATFWWERSVGFHKMNTRDRTDEASVSRGTKQSLAFTLGVYS